MDQVLPGFQMPVSPFTFAGKEENVERTWLDFVKESCSGAIVRGDWKWSFTYKMYHRATHSVGIEMRKWTNFLCKSLEFGGLLLGNKSLFSSSEWERKFPHPRDHRHVERRSIPWLLTSMAQMSCIYSCRQIHSRLLHAVCLLYSLVRICRSPGKPRVHPCQSVRMSVEGTLGCSPKGILMNSCSPRCTGVIYISGALATRVAC